MFNVHVFTLTDCPYILCVSIIFSGYDVLEQCFHTRFASDGRAGILIFSAHLWYNRPYYASSRLTDKK